MAHQSAVKMSLSIPCQVKLSDEFNAENNNPRTHYISFPRPWKNRDVQGREELLESTVSLHVFT